MGQATAAVLGASLVRPAAAPDDQTNVSAAGNVTNVQEQRINAETIRLDISRYVGEHAMAIAVASRVTSGVPVRIVGDGDAIVEARPHNQELCRS
jgi:hypothetical protein